MWSKQNIYYAAKSGMAVALCEHLSLISEDERIQILSESVDDDGQRCTPLIIAARNGHVKVIQALLKHHLDLEQEGVVKFDGYVIEGASPLWCATGAGHLSVIKILVRAGADINHKTKTNSSPLRAACFEGRLDIVKYLVSHGADYNVANIYNNTCLMIAAYKGNLDVVLYLLELNVDPNVTAHCGATAMHFAAECGHVSIVKALLDHGGKFVSNQHGMTPLLEAAERTRADVVEYLIKLDVFSKLDRINALELLGASFASDKDNYNIDYAYNYLLKGMQERYSDSNNVIRKEDFPLIPAYDNRVECKTLEELEEIKHMSAVLHKESLVIRERILGRNNPEVPQPIIFRGAVYADNGRFDRCLQLWLHALNLKQENFVDIYKDLLRFAQVFSQMIFIGVSLEFEIIEEVLEANVKELQRLLLKLRNPSIKDDVESIQEEIECSMITSLYLIMIAVNVARGQNVPRPNTAHGIGLLPESHSRLESSLAVYGVSGQKSLSLQYQRESRIHHLVYRLVKLNAKTRQGRTLLHIAVHPETPVDDFHTYHVCNDFLTLHSIISALINAGAHMDTVNELGATPFESATTGVAEIILRTQKKLSLACLAARAVKMQGISYVGLVPKHLESFIELHGPTHVAALQENKNKQTL